MSIEKIISDIIDAKLAPVLAALTELRGAATPGTLEWIPARTCGLRPTTRRKLTAAGSLPTSKVGRELFVRRDAVAKYFASQTVAAPAADEADRVLQLVRSRR